MVFVLHYHLTPPPTSETRPPLADKPDGGSNYEIPGVLAILEASMRGRQRWLCCESFCVMATVHMGNRDDEWLPSHPRELTTLLGIFQEFLPLALVAVDEGTPST